MVAAQDELLTLSDVLNRLRVGRSTLYLLINRSSFPRPVKIGNSNRWLSSEVEAWVATRERASIAVE